MSVGAAANGAAPRAANEVRPAANGAPPAPNETPAANEAPAASSAAANRPTKSTKDGPNPPPTPSGSLWRLALERAHEEVAAEFVGTDRRSQQYRDALATRRQKIFDHAKENGGMLPAKKVAQDSSSGKGKQKKGEDQAGEAKVGAKNEYRDDEGDFGDEDFGAAAKSGNRAAQASKASAAAASRGAGNPRGGEELLDSRNPRAVNLLKTRCSSCVRVGGKFIVFETPDIPLYKYENSSPEILFAKVGDQQYKKFAIKDYFKNGVDAPGDAAPALQRCQQAAREWKKDYLTKIASLMTGAGNTGSKNFGLTREEHNEIAHARNHERKKGKPKKSSDENEDESEGEQKNERAGSSSGASSVDLGAADVEDGDGLKKRGATVADLDEADPPPMLFYPEDSSVKAQQDLDLITIDREIDPKFLGRVSDFLPTQGASAAHRRPDFDFASLDTKPKKGFSSPFNGTNMQAGSGKSIAPESRVAGINWAGPKNAKDKI